MKNNITITQLYYLLNDSTIVLDDETNEIIKKITELYEEKVKRGIENNIIKEMFVELSKKIQITINNLLEQKSKLEEEYEILALYTGSKQIEIIDKKIKMLQKLEKRLNEENMNTYMCKNYEMCGADQTTIIKTLLKEISTTTENNGVKTIKMPQFFGNLSILKENEQRYQIFLTTNNGINNELVDIILSLINSKRKIENIKSIVPYIKIIKEHQTKILKLKERLGTINKIIEENEIIFDYIKLLYENKTFFEKAKQQMEEYNNNNKLVAKIDKLKAVKKLGIKDANAGIKEFEMSQIHNLLEKLFMKLENYNPERKPQYDDYTRRLHDYTRRLHSNTRQLLDTFETKYLSTKQIIESLYDLNLNIPFDAKKEDILNAIIEIRNNIEKEITEMEIKIKELKVIFQKKLETYDEETQEVAKKHSDTFITIDEMIITPAKKGLNPYIALVLLKALNTINNIELEEAALCAKELNPEQYTKCKSIIKESITLPNIEEIETSFEEILSEDLENQEQTQAAPAKARRI